MARDQERGARIRALYEDTKAARPETTWRQIADAVDVSERAAAAWPKTGGISYENAKKLAAFFKKLGHDVDVDYIWRGPESDVPDLVGTLGAGRSLDGQFEARLNRLEEIAQENNSLLVAIAIETGVLKQSAAARALQGVEEWLERKAVADRQASQDAPSARRRATG